MKKNTNAQQNKNRKSRQALRLDPKLEKNLVAYTLAAAAAGVGLLALSNAAEAKIVYTKTYQVIPPNHSLSLDFYKKGVTNFVIANKSAATSYRVYDRIYVNAAVPNSFVGFNSQPSALRSGSRVGSGAPFYSGHREGLSGGYVHVYGTMETAFYPPRRTSGPWAQVGSKTRYLGLKFTIKGQYHYGWARLHIKSTKGREHARFTAFLTGYAYETIPNRAIITGKTKGRNAIALDPVTLGTLAVGTK
jgi:hypothetical protein